MTTTKSAMKIKYVGNGGVPTFQLIPLEKDVFFNEAVFDRTVKILIVVSKEKYESFAFVPKVTSKGQYIPIPTKKDNEQMKYEQERRNIEKFYEYNIVDRAEIEEFCARFAGMTSADLDEYYAVPEELTPKNQDNGPDASPTPKIITLDK